MPNAISRLFSSVRIYASDPTHRVILRGAVESMSVRVGGLVLSYTATVVLSRLLGLAEYGRYAIALSWVLVLSLFAKAGFDNSSLRYATIYLERKDGAALRAFIHFAVTTIIAISLGLGAVILIGGRRFAGEDARLLLWAALMVPPLALLTFYSVLMRVARRVIASQFYDQMVRPLLIIAAAATMSVVGVNLTSRTALMVTTPPPSEPSPFFGPTFEGPLHRR